MICVYTGDGKGKTTAAMGQIIRALGHKKKICLLQLFKRKEYYGEQRILKNLKNLDFFSFAPYHPFCNFPIGRTFVRPVPECTCRGGEQLHESEIIKKQCKKAMDCLKKMLTDKKYDLVVLDEFNIALRDGFILLNDLLKVLKLKSKNQTIIITGRGAPKSLIKIADLVTEFKELKHPFKKGIKAKQGIEY